VRTPDAMGGGGLPPGVLAALQQQGAPPEADPQETEDPAVDPAGDAEPMGAVGPVPPPPTTLDTFDPSPVLDAITTTAGKAAMASDARDVLDLAQAVLALAQAATTLDPMRLVGGDTPGARLAALPPTKDGNHNGVIGA